MLNFKKFIKSVPRVTSLGTAVLISQGKHSVKNNLGINEENIFPTKEKTVQDLKKSNRSFYSSVGKMHNSLVSHYNFDNPEDIHHIEKYAGDSTIVNRHLYNHHNNGGSSDVLPENSDVEHINGLDKALQRIKTPTEMSVFSGTGFHPGMMASKNKENKLHMPAYTSTSIDPSVAVRFAKGLVKGSHSTRYDVDKDEQGEGSDHHILQIHLPANHPGAYIPHHSDFGEDEKEFLLPRNTSIKLHPVPEIREFANNGRINRMHVWHAWIA